MMLEALCQVLQIFPAERSGASRMDQTRMLWKPSGGIHYNVKPRLSNLASTRRADQSLPAGSHPWKALAHDLGGLC